MDNSKMKHDCMSHDCHPPMGHTDHDHHAMMIADFRKKILRGIDIGCTDYVAVNNDLSFNKIDSKFFQISSLPI